MIYNIENDLLSEIRPYMLLVRVHNQKVMSAIVEGTKKEANSSEKLEIPHVNLEDDTKGKALTLVVQSEDATYLVG